MYIGFVNGGFKILWCEYLWVAASPCGGFGGPPPRKFRNMKCSRSDSRPILGLLRAIDRYTVKSGYNMGVYRICKSGFRNFMV